MRDHDQHDPDEAEFLDLGVASKETEGCPHTDLEGAATQAEPPLPGDC